MSQASADNFWVNTADRQAPERLAQAHHILQTERFCTLATVDSVGFPWASPLLYGYDAALTFYWSSAIASRHSVNLQETQGRCAVTIFDSHASPGGIAGLFLTGTGELVPEDKVAQAMEHLFDRMDQRPDRRASDYLSDSPRRFYRFQPSEIWITGDRLPVGNQLVDTKVALDVGALRGAIGDEKED
jgi:nitroimidazol reductase NimA-like FMN-containing flavoprotein (pyridoxamine 5'-phosphate oxidase superfamily)